jgi:hypothetical protein
MKKAVRARISQSQPSSAKVLAKHEQSDLQWKNQLLRRSVLAWYERRAAQFVLVLPGNDEIVIRFENDDWYVRGRIEGTEPAPKFFGTLREALASAEKLLLEYGEHLLVLLRREDGRATSSVTPLQRQFLTDLGAPKGESNLTRDEASERIRRCVIGR